MSFLLFLVGGAVPLWFTKMQLGMFTKNLTS